MRVTGDATPQLSCPICVDSEMGEGATKGLQGGAGDGVLVAGWVRDKDGGVIGIV